MKKRKVFKIQPLFNKEKNFLKLLSQKDGMSKLEELGKVIEKMQFQKEAEDLMDWYVRSSALLPNDCKETFKEELLALINKYMTKE